VLIGVETAINSSKQISKGRRIRSHNLQHLTRNGGLSDFLPKVQYFAADSTKSGPISVKTHRTKWRSLAVGQWHSLLLWTRSSVSGKAILKSRSKLWQPTVF